LCIKKSSKPSEEGAQGISGRYQRLVEGLWSTIAEDIFQNGMSKSTVSPIR